MAPRGFEADLARFGPGCRAWPSPEASRAYCQELTATHYENFHVVTWMTPRALRPAFEAVYSYCRWSDDLADELGDPGRSLELLAWWRSQLDRLYAGHAEHPVMQALAPVVREYGIPRQPLADLLSAFEQDQRVTDYATYAQLLDYCVRSANPVGHLVLYLGRSFTPENSRLADATCTALQLANFWQDVVPDLQRGRIYLPAEDRDRFGVTREDLAERRATPGFLELMRFEVARGRELLHAGWPLVRRIPRWMAVDVDLFTRGGLAILDRIERQGFDVLRARPAISKAAKLGLLLRAMLARGPDRRAARSVQSQDAASGLPLVAGRQ